MGDLTYLDGFGNHFATEAVPGALPQGQNSPQRCPYDLYAEQLSGTAFTVPRSGLQRSWLYKLRPSAAEQTEYQKHDNGHYLNNFGDFELVPTQLRWKAPELPSADHAVDFVSGISTICGAGDPSVKTGIGMYTYVCNTSMTHSAFYSADGDLLIVPQQGTLHLETEMGRLRVESKEIVVVPRGIKFAVKVDGQCRGYIAEVFSGHFKIPDLGPIGANGLANPRDFKAPVAWYEDYEGPFTVIAKYCGQLFSYSLPYSVFDVVAWHGNYYPYKYDLRQFNVMNTVSYDHPDPSIFTVLTSATTEAGVAALDFAIFPPRWMVGEHTFRPPYYHRNTMSEFMGNIAGTYDAKPGGFVPGGASLHVTMTAHGPEKTAFEQASIAELKPVRYSDNDLAFMFETTYLLKVAPHALARDKLDTEYLTCYAGFEKKFRRPA